MAFFEDAFAFLKPDEGGYVNNPQDPGGETFGGISRRYNPRWPGWARVDALRAAGAHLSEINSDPGLLTSQRDYFREEYWLDVYERINSQAIANKVFDFAVNMDPVESMKGRAHTLLQQACIDCNSLVSADGVFGELTLHAVNSCDPVLLLQAYKKRALSYYQHLVAVKPADSCFLVGWCRRAMR